MIVEGVKDKVGPEGLVPTLLVYDTLRHTALTADSPAAPTYCRAAAMHKASREVRKCFAEVQVRDTLQTYNGPSLATIHVVPIGGYVLECCPQYN